MKRIVAKRALRDFWERYPDARDYLEIWHETVKGASWSNPNEIRQFYSTVSVLKNARVVFNIKGNHYRLVARINYQKQWLFIRFIGTHSEYDKINAEEI